MTPQAPAFIPIDLSAPRSTNASDPPPPDVPSAPVDSIRIECQRPGMTVTVHWPLSDAAGCARVLKDVLR